MPAEKRYHLFRVRLQREAAHPLKHRGFNPVLRNARKEEAHETVNKRAEGTHSYWNEPKFYIESAR